MHTHRHDPMWELMETVRRKYRGHENCYGLIGNSESLKQFTWQTRRVLFGWLNRRRRQRRSHTWTRFERLLKRFEVTMPRVVERIRGEWCAT